MLPEAYINDKVFFDKWMKTSVGKIITIGNTEYLANIQGNTHSFFYSDIDNVLKGGSKVITYYYNGQVESEGQYEHDGELPPDDEPIHSGHQGLWRRWNDNAEHSLIWEAQYVDGKKHGIERCYYIYPNKDGKYPVRCERECVKGEQVQVVKN